MKKFMLSVFAIATLCLFVGTYKAEAVFISGPGGGEYNLETINPLGAPTYTAGRDLGYFIWATDVDRRHWSIRWSGNDLALTGSQKYLFSGNIFLSNNTVNPNPSDLNQFAYTEISFDNDDDSEPNDDDNAINFNARVTNFEDGLDIDIVGNILPSYILFDLNAIRLSGSSSISPITNHIYIGSGELHPEDQDFAFAAPVPEPGTMVLLGAGLLGLAIFGKRRMNNA